MTRITKEIAAHKPKCHRCIYGEVQKLLEWFLMKEKTLPAYIQCVANFDHEQVKIKLRRAF